MVRAGLIQRQGSIYEITARGSQTLRTAALPAGGTDRRAPDVTAIEQGAGA